MLEDRGPVRLIVTLPPCFNLIDYDGDQPTEGQLSDAVQMARWQALEYCPPGTVRPRAQ